MPKPTHKGKRSRRGRFTILDEALMNTDAWRTLKPGPRALYVELKRRFSGSNNGQIFLSHRDAAEALNVSKNTVGPWFKQLASRGFIHETQGAFLGPSGMGQATLWAISEAPTADGQPAKRAYRHWKNENPVPKIGRSRTKNADLLQVMEVRIVKKCPENA